MKRFLGIKTLMLTLTLLLGSVVANATERPFSFTGRGVSTPILNEAGQPIGINVTGSGNGTHLGSFTTLGQIFFSTDPNDPIGSIPRAMPL